MTSPSNEATNAPADQNAAPMVIGPDGQPVDPNGPFGSDDEDGTPFSELISRPDKVMRIGSMIKQLLDEVRAAPLDEASRARLREIHRRSIEELEAGPAPPARGEPGGALP